MAITGVPSDYVRVEKTVIGEQIKGEELNIVRNQKILALLESNGRITFNHSGKRMEFDIRKSRNSLTPYTDGGSLDFPRVNRWEDAVLPWRGYTASESIGKLEKLKSQGPEARVDFVAKTAEALMDDVRYGFGAKFFVDGNATGYTSDIHGFESFLGYTGTNQYTAPSDTYAGVDTTLGNLGGSVLSGSWPDGQFDPEYDAWSPLFINYTHASWTATTKTWPNTCVEAMRAGLIFNQNIRGAQQGNIEMILMTALMYSQFLALLDSKERIVVNRGQESKLVSMGFQGITNFDGVDCSYESEVPASRAYGINTQTMELKSMQPSLFIPSDDFDLDYIADRYAIDFFGNLQCNPRGFLYFRNIT